ncbi:sulfurtransferase [Mucilaginibacter sp. PAMC 26640]|nr:sulfurtransferase [Mucilaginibacter sp. PAMC 26640]
MKIEQFEDKALSHYSYAILSECENEVMLVDPSRNIAPYMAFAEQNNAKIIGIIETHPHADFISGHLELHQLTGATIYCSALLGANYPHLSVDEGSVLQLGGIKLKILNTPGHSPDSISIVLEHEGKDKAVFTGDTLFIGDCGRPDLRETAGNLTAKREDLAALMYHSLRDKLMLLDNDVLVYPAHGAGTLCGKALSDANCSTMQTEKVNNWSLQEMKKGRFITELLRDQPFIPKYFPYDVAVNKQGAYNLAEVIANVNRLKPDRLDKGSLIVDTRQQSIYKAGHQSGSVNLQAGGKFETWLGSIVSPGEVFYLVADNEVMLETMIARTTKIGYESFIKAAYVVKQGDEMMDELKVNEFTENLSAYTIVDVRNAAEIKDKPLFDVSIKIPLQELRERLQEIPLDKPIVVHCAGGYRSAAGSSIVQSAIGDRTKVYDLGEAVLTLL